MFKPVPPLPRDPHSRSEWRTAADGAYTLLLLDSCRQYGLIAGGPKVNVERCELIIRRAKMRGIHAVVDDELLAELIHA